MYGKLSRACNIDQFSGKLSVINKVKQFKTFYYCQMLLKLSNLTNNCQMVFAILNWFCLHFVLTNLIKWKQVKLNVF